MISHHVQMALRGFRRNKLPTAVNLLSLWMGLAGFVAAYVIASDFLSVSSRYPDADRIHVLTQNVTASGLEFSNVPITAASAARYLETDLPQLEAIARVLSAPVEHAVVTDRAKTYQDVLFADPGYLDIFPEPIRGAGASNPLHQPLSAVISPTAARSLFGTDLPVGATFRLAAAVDVAVVGVFDATPVSQLTNEFDMLVSMDTLRAIERAETGSDSEQAGAPDIWFPENLMTFMLLPADGSLTPDQLSQHLASFADRHVDPELLDEASIGFGAIHVSELIVAAIDMMSSGALGIPITSLIMLVGILILGMSCLNYASLAAAQSFLRSKHVGLLKVFGAKRWQVFGQSLIEASLLVGGALVLALITAEIAMPFANEAMGMTMDLPYTTSATLWLVLVAIIGAVAVVAGSYPALLLARVKTVSALRAGSGRGGRSRIRRLLVGFQFTTASFLLILVLVMLAHNGDLRARGLDAIGAPIVVMSSPLPNAETTRDAFASALTSHPAIESVTATGLVPWSLNQLDAATMSRNPGADGPGINFLLNDVDYDFFATMGTDVLAGRTFSRERGEDRFFWGETPAESVSRPLHAVVDRSAAQRFGFADPAAAIGQTVHRRWSGFSRPVEIIGVVEDTPYKLVGMGIATASIFFLQPNDTLMHLIRVDADRMADALVHIDETWDAFAPDVPIKRELMNDMFEEAVSIFELLNTVFAALALFAVLVASVGLFGAATYATNRRVHEIGVRKTLGANSSSIVRLLVLSFTRPVLIANLIAWPIAYLAMQVYFSLFVFRADASFTPFVGSLVLTLAVAWLTVASLTYRAARVRPADVLRQE